MSKSTVPTLAAERTYWEKATLIHYENMRNDGPRTPKRYARHRYGLYQLDKHLSIGASARADTNTRDRVIAIKSLQFYGKGVDYEDVRTGKLRLLPSVEHRAVLENDYKAMHDAGMFFRAEPPSFSKVLGHLEVLQEALNTASTNTD